MGNSSGTDGAVNAAVAPAPDIRTLTVGTRLGRYVIGPRLARGGMAELYAARATGIGAFDKLVALKLVLPHLKDDPAFTEMFMREAKTAAALDHPNIVSVFDLGFAQGEYFIAMEHVHGRDLRAIMADTADEDTAELTTPIALGIVSNLAAALHHAHEATGPEGEPLGLVHRDVSPANVLVRYDGVVKLTDFGIAKAAAGTQATRTGTIKGKRGYMSPEQCLGRPLDRRSDIFNLGILLYELTTRQRLFVADSEFTVLNQIIHGTFAPPRQVVPGYPRALERIVLRALEVDPGARYPTAAALIGDLRLLPPHLRPRTDDAAIGAWMRAAYEVPDPPHFEVPARPTPMPDPEPMLAAPADTTVVSAPGSTPRRRLWAIAVAIVAFATGGLAWERTRAAFTHPLAPAAAVPEPSATEPPAAAASVAAREPTPTPVPAAPAPAPIPTAVVDEVTAADEPAPTTAAAATSAPDGRAATSSRPRRKSKKPRKPPASEASPAKPPAEAKAKDDRWRDLLPPSMK